MRIDPKTKKFELFKKAREIFLAARRRHGNLDHGYEVVFSNSASRPFPNVQIFFPMSEEMDEDESEAYTTKRQWSRAAEEANIPVEWEYTVLVRFESKENVKAVVSKPTEAEALEATMKKGLRKALGNCDKGEPGVTFEEEAALEDLPSNPGGETPLHDFWKMTPEDEFLSQQKLRVLGVPEELVSSQNSAYGWIGDNLRTYIKKYYIDQEKLFNRLKRPRSRREGESEQDYQSFRKTWVEQRMKRIYERAHKETAQVRNRFIEEVLFGQFKALQEDLEKWGLSCRLQFDFVFDAIVGGLMIHGVDVAWEG